jgi:hypothetical protein
MTEALAAERAATLASGDGAVSLSGLGARSFADLMRPSERRPRRSPVPDVPDHGLARLEAAAAAAQAEILAAGLAAAEAETQALAVEAASRKETETKPAAQPLRSRSESLTVREAEFVGPRILRPGAGRPELTVPYRQRRPSFTSSSASADAQAHKSDPVPESDTPASEFVEPLHLPPLRPDHKHDHASFDPLQSNPQETAWQPRMPSRQTADATVSALTEVGAMSAAAAQHVRRLVLPLRFEYFDFAPVAVTARYAEEAVGMIVSWLIYVGGSDARAPALPVPAQVPMTARVQPGTLSVPLSVFLIPC